LFNVRGSQKAETHPIRTDSETFAIGSERLPMKMKLLECILTSWFSGLHVANSSNSVNASMDGPETASLESPDSKLLTPSPKSYAGKVVSEKPKVPRQIREIQENLTFEKVRRTVTKNNVK
jgi:hypothetical protein